MKIFKYVTENTFDSYNWSLIEKKQRFIGQIFTSKSPVRSMEDVDEATLSYAEIKSLATGNPLIKEKMDLERDLTKLKILRSNNIASKHSLQDQLQKQIPNEIKQTKISIKKLKQDVEKMNIYANQDFSIQLGEQTYTDKKIAGEIILKACSKIKRIGEFLPIGTYKGFDLSLSMGALQNTFQIKLQNDLSYITTIENNSIGTITRMNNTLNNIEKKIEEKEQNLIQLNEDIKIIEQEIIKPFAKEPEYQEKKLRLKELLVIFENMGQESTFDKKEGIHQKNEKQSIMSNLKQKNNINHSITGNPKEKSISSSKIER